MYVSTYRCMLNKWRIKCLAKTNQVCHFCKTTVIFGQVPVLLTVSHKIITKPYSTERKKTNKKATSSNIVTSLSSF